MANATLSDLAIAQNKFSRVKIKLIILFTKLIIRLKHDIYENTNYTGLKTPLKTQVRNSKCLNNYLHCVARETQKIDRGFESRSVQKLKKING